MMKQLKKVISILCAIALLVSGMVFALAEEPAIDQAAAEETAVIEPAVEEPAAEQPAADETVVEEPVVEEPAVEEIKVEEPVIEETKVEEPVAEETKVEEPVAEETKVEEPVAEETKVEEPVAEETKVEEPAAEETKVEEPAAEETKVEEPVAEETKVEEPAAEETKVEESAAEEPVFEVSADEEPVQGDASYNNEESSDNDEEEIENWGWVDSVVIEENTPAITDAFKGLRDAEMNIGEILIDTLEFGQELTVTLRASEASTIELKLYANNPINTKVDGKAVNFTPVDSDVPSMNLYVYELENAAGRTHDVVLSSNDTVSFRLAAVAKQSEAVETSSPAEVVPAEVNNEEIPSEETEDNNDEEIPSEETEDNNDEEIPSEGTEENNDEEIPSEETEASVNEYIAETPVETPEPTIQTSVKTYDALKVGSQISDTLLAGQKAKIQVKCGKHLDVTLTLNANPDDLTVTIDGSDAQFTSVGDGTYTVELNNVAFRKFSVVISAKQDMGFTLSASSSTEAETEDEPEDEAEDEAEVYDEETDDEDEAETESDTDDEEMNEEPAEEIAEEAIEENTDKDEISEEETEGIEEEAVEENSDEENEKMTALGFTRVVVTAEEGADLYAEASKESEVLGHLDTNAEAWVTLNDEKTFGLIYNDEEDVQRFVSMCDVDIVGAEEDTRSITVTSSLDDQETIYLGSLEKVTANLEGFLETDKYELQWMYSPDAGENYYPIEGANDITYSFLTDEENVYYLWKVDYTLLDEEE